MIKKKTIGKIQLVIGIALVIISIIVGIYYYSWYNEQKTLYSVIPTIEQIIDEPYSNENVLFYFNNLNAEYNLREILFSGLSLTIILLAISTMLVLEGLVNISGDKK